MQSRTIKSAERALALFEIFSAAERPLSVSEVTRALGIPQSSTTMLLKNMTELGYLDYSLTTRKYQPTIRALLLNSWMSRRFRRSDIFIDEFDKLHDTVGEITQLVFQNGPMAQGALSRGVDQSGRHNRLTQSSFGGDHFVIRTGLSAPLTVSSVGRALLSLKPDKEILSLVRRCNSLVEPHLRFTEAAIMKSIEKIRRSGYAESNGNYVPGVATLAVCVPSPLATAPLGLFLSMSTEHMAKKRDTALAALLSFKQKVSNPALGPAVGC